ncbi:MAG: hypothetical protein QNK29_15505 [Desulfobacterales bacterium]|nr:hypothetical protein [Desulfobacterales bacterium]
MQVQAINENGGVAINFFREVAFHENIDITDAVSVGYADGKRAHKLKRWCLMPKLENKKSYPFDKPGNYRIHVLGSLDHSWSAKLGGFQITIYNQKDQEEPVTELIGKVRDQAELAGLLNSLYELHLTLLSVNQLHTPIGRV